jgi:hypothetical protein
MLDLAEYMASNENERQQPLIERDRDLESSNQQLEPASIAQLAKEFFVMGWVGFGGPAANIGLFQKVGWVWASS